MTYATFYAFALPIVLLACSSSPKTKADLAHGGRSNGGESNVAGKDSSSSAGRGGAGGSAGHSAITDFTGALGRRCDDQNSCESGLDCFLPNGTTFGDVGPAGGLCSIRCSTDDDCKPYAEISSKDVPRCVAFLTTDKTSTVCMPGCRLGDKTACGGRDEMACWQLDSSPSDGTGRVCVPLCNHDDQCPPGTVCDGSTNLCAAWASTGGYHLGDDCDPTVENECSNGICLDFGTGGVCTAYCRIGTFPQCGGDGEDAICGWVFAGDETAGPADSAMCAETCACDADCSSGSYCLNEPSRKNMAKPGVCAIGSVTGIEKCP
jgi:hypothetical protein